jgi:carbamoyl-phosphate synthase large subunit
MKELCVGVSGINAIDNPGPGVGIARSLKEDKALNVRVVGLAYDAMEPGIYLDWLIDKAFIVPYSSGGQSEYLERLAYIQQNHGLDFVIPSLDAELPLYIKAAPDLERMGIKTFLPTSDQFRLRAKDRLSHMAQQIGIHCPEFQVVTSSQELSQAIETLGLPVMVKGSFYKAHRANTLQEAISYYTEIVAEWGYPVIVQKMVQGEEMNVVGVGDGTGTCLGMVGIKKLSITSQGKIWNGVTIRNQQMLEAAQRFVEVFRWKGGFELECMVDGDTVYLIEINPRLPAWSYFATAVGVNLPAIMIRAAYDMPVQPFSEYEAGKLFIRYTYELVTDMQCFQQMSIRGENSHETKL